MPPVIAIVGSALISIGVPAAIATTIATIGVNLAVAVGLNLVSKALKPKPAQGMRGDHMKPSNDPNVPRQAILGRFGTAGSLVTWQTWGKNNEYICLLFAVADHKCNALKGAWWNGKAITINPTTGVVAEAQAGGNDWMWVRFHNGDWNQSANATLIANSGGRWTSNDRGRGVSYIELTARAEASVHPQGLSGLFSCIWDIEGMPLYDRRLDSSVGGSGSQRWNDQTTWAYSENAYVAWENVLRGLRVENTSQAVGSRTTDVFFGGSLTDAELPFAEAVSGMNSCDENVTLRAGGTEKRYRACGMVMGDEAPADVLDGLVAAMAGKTVMGPPRTFALAGVARTPVRTFTDADFRPDGESSYQDFTPLAEIVNYVSGRYYERTERYQAVQVPPRTSTTYEAQDGGRKGESFDLRYVPSVSQAQRVHKIFLERHRRQKTARRTLTPENLDLEAGDWVTWQSDRYGWTLSFEIGAIGPRTDDEDFLKIVADLTETDSGVYAWTPATDEVIPSNPASLTPGAVTSDTVAGLAVTATSLAVGYEVVPALQVTWTAITDPSAVSVIVKARVVGTTTELVFGHQILPGVPQAVLASAGVIGAQVYEVSAAVVYTPLRVSAYSSWVQASAPTPATVASTAGSQNLVQNPYFLYGGLP